jgi:hypothetical protein
VFGSSANMMALTSVLSFQNVIFVRKTINTYNLLFSKCIIREFVKLYSFHSIPFHSIPFHSIPFHSIPFHSIPFHSIPFHNSQYYYTVDSPQIGHAPDPDKPVALRTCPILRPECKFNSANFESDNCPIRGLKYPHTGQFVILQEILTFQEIKVIETNFNGSYFVPLGQKSGENALIHRSSNLPDVAGIIYIIYYIISSSWLGPLFQQNLTGGPKQTPSLSL